MINENGSTQNTLFTGDNLFILRGINSGSVDLIYLDPPFNSKRTYSAPIGSKAKGTSFKDIWTWNDVDESYLEGLMQKFPQIVYYIQSIEGMHSKAMMAYITYMAQRLIELHRILKDTGSMYLHCDPTASHYIKPILDFLFGKDGFRNEIIWAYDKWTAPSVRQYQRNHDVIFYYSKSNSPYFETLTEIDDKRQITLDRGYTTNLLKDGTRQLIIYKGSEDRENIIKLKEKSKFKNIIIKPLNELGNPLKDWWRINIIHPKAKERTGYPTQKPLELLKRIILSSCPEGGVVIDPFCGCATTCVAAQQLGRKWIGIDIEAKAAELLIERLSDDAGLFSNFIHRTDIPQRSDVIIQQPNEKNIKETLYKDQAGNCNGCQQYFEIRHFEVDHIVPKSKGGGDYIENYQLLCSSCNRIKGNRPMEYLRMKVQAIKDMLNKKLTFGE